MRIAAARTELAPTTLPVPTKHLFETWSDESQYVVRNQADVIVIRMRHLCTHSCLLQPCMRRASVVCQETQYAQSVVLDFPTCANFHGAKNAQRHACGVSLSRCYMVVQQHTEHQKTDILDATMRRVQLH